MIDEFNRTHTIHVEASFMRTPKELRQNLEAGIAIGNPPDLALVAGPPEVARFSKTAWLTPTQEFVDGPDGFSTEQLRDFQPAFLEDSRLFVAGRKELVSWPFSKDLSVLFYNRRLLDQAGITGPPRTWGEFRQDLLAVKDRTQATPLEWTPDVYFFWTAILRGNGGDLLSPAADQVAFDTGAGVAALQYEVDLVNTDRTAILTTGFDWFPDFAAGNVAFAVSTSARRSSLMAAMPADSKGDLAMAPLPGGTAGAANLLFGNSLAIFNRGARSRQRAAWLFIKWLTDTDQTLAWSLAGGFLPLRNSAIGSTTYQARVSADPQLEALIDALPDAGSAPGSPVWDQISPVLNTMCRMALVRRLTPRQALDDAAAKVTAILQAD